MEPITIGLIAAAVLGGGWLLTRKSSESSAPTPAVPPITFFSQPLPEFSKEQASQILVSMAALAAKPVDESITLDKLAKVDAVVVTDDKSATNTASSYVGIMALQPDTTAILISSYWVAEPIRPRFIRASKLGQELNTKNFPGYAILTKKPDRPNTGASGESLGIWSK